MVSQRLLLLASAFLASTTSAFHVNPAQASPAPKSTSTRSTSRLSYSATMDVPESARTHAFEQKMRKLVLPKEEEQEEQAKSSTSTTSSTSRLPNMMDLTTRAEFREHVKNEHDKMTIVRFHAPFCRACKAMQPAWERLAREHPEIKFVNIAYSKQDAETKALIQELRVRKVPQGQVYHPMAGLVETANFGKKHFDNVVKHIEWYASGECALPRDVDQDSLVYESPYINLHP